MNPGNAAAFRCIQGWHAHGRPSIARNAISCSGCVAISITWTAPAPWTDLILFMRIVLRIICLQGSELKPIMNYVL